MKYLGSNAQTVLFLTLVMKRGVRTKMQEKIGKVAVRMCFPFLNTFTEEVGKHMFKYLIKSPPRLENDQKYGDDQKNI